jgi:hypothetical protein
MSVAAVMMISASATTRKDGHPLVTHVFVDLVVSRLASFFAERGRTRLFTVFARTDIFLNETLRSDRSTLSRYRIERAGSCTFLTRTQPSKGAAPRPAVA